MVDFAKMLKNSIAKQQARKDEEAKYPTLMQNADKALLDRKDIILPSDTKANSKSIKFAPNLKPKAHPKEKPSFATLIKKSKQPKEKSKLGVLHGTGFTKKLAIRAQKAVAKQEVVKPTEFKIAKTPPSQPPVISLPIPSDIKWDKYQLAALKGMRTEKYSCLIGAAGTGKTTVTKQLVVELEQNVATIDLNSTRVHSEDAEPEYNVAICFVSFTGRAVQQMKKALPKEYHPMCNTVHATLGFKPVFYEIEDEKTGKMRNTVRFEPTFTAMNKLSFQVCVIDEGGMVPIPLWNQLFAALPDGCKIIIIRDITKRNPAMVKNQRTGFTLNFCGYVFLMNV